ncbi:MAG TPA: copper transporter [Acidimicrobiales bacterium]|nr:copper transporter [Acidimicrobiales bacterium]
MSFRFHLVSIIGVFLALGIGIAIGASVVDRATVSALERQLDAVGDRADRTNSENDRLRNDVSRWERFADEAGDELVEGRLLGVDVVVVGVQGIDREPIDRLRQSIVAAGARLRGTVWLTGKLQLEEPADVASLSDALVVAPGPADLVRRTLIERLAGAWAAGESASPLARLRETGFAELEAVDEATLAPSGTRFVVVAGDKADVPNDVLAVPLAAELAELAPTRVVAVESGREATAATPAVRAVFVGPLRGDDDSSSRLSTVDNIESYRGRIAAVLALADLGPQGKVGHYGVGPRASRMVPEPASP